MKYHRRASNILINLKCLDVCFELCIRNAIDTLNLHIYLMSHSFQDQLQSKDKIQTSNGRINKQTGHIAIINCLHIGTLPWGWGLYKYSLRVSNINRLVLKILSLFDIVRYTILKI